MVSTPLRYMSDVVLACIQKRMFDAPYSAGLKLCQLANSMPENARYENTYLPIIELIQTVSLYYVFLEKSIITNQLCKSISIFLINLYHKSYWQFIDVLKLVLDYYSTIIYSVIKIGKEYYHGLIFQTAITNAYATISEQSLSRLLYIIADKDVKIDTSDKDMNDMLSVSAVLKDHFRKLSDNNDFGSNRMLRDILECISDILKVFIWYAESSQDEDRRDVIVKKMIKPFLWLIPTYFYKKNNIDGDFERQAANTIAYTALSCVNFEWNNHDIFETASKLIRNIIDNHCNTSGIGNGYGIVYLLKLLWRLRFVADKYEMSASRDDIDKLIEKKPDVITDEDWNLCQAYLEKKKKSLQDYIEKDDSRFSNTNDSSLDAFMKALKNKLN